MGASEARSRAFGLQPAGRAAALYAVCTPSLAGRRLTVEGRRINAVPFGRFALLLSYVDPAQTPSEADDARVRERAIERAALHGAVVPLRSPSLVADARDLVAYARDRTPQLVQTLARFRDRRECAVHAFAGPHVPPGGEPYLVRVAANVTRSARAPRAESERWAAATERAKTTWEAGAALADSMRRVRTGGRRGALWSAVLLVRNDRVAALRDLVDRDAAAAAAAGNTFHFEGPRAPFSFV